jgi:hypothetical protein
LHELGATARLFIDRACCGIAKDVGVEATSIHGVEPAEVPSRAWDTVLLDFAPTDVIVDTFPEGLDLEVDPKRYTDGRWVGLLRCRRDAQSPVFRNALSNYALSYDLEPRLEWAPRGVVPFGEVVRDLGSDVVSEGSSCQVLLVATESRHHALFERLEARFRGAGLDVRRVPEAGQGRSDATLLHRRDLQAKVVVGPAGYNLTYELAALGIWHLALPVGRQYDCQDRRAEKVAVRVHSPDALERRVIACLGHGGARAPHACRSMAELARELMEPGRIAQPTLA